VSAPDVMPDEEFEALMMRALVSLVTSGRITPEHFVSPAAHRRFCQKNGIAP